MANFGVQSAQDYDFYTTPPASAGAVPAPRAPRYGAPTNQFGSAVAPAAHAPVAAALPGRRGVPPLVWRLGGPLAVLVVLGVLGVGRLGFIGAADVTPPTTVAGQSVSQDPVLLALVPEILAGVRSDNPGIEVDGQAYGSVATAATVVLIAEGGLDVDAEVADSQASDREAGLPAATPVEVGGSTCLVVAPSGMTCMRSGWRSSVEVFLISGTGTPTAAEAAAVLDEVWNR